MRKIILLLLVSLLTTAFFRSTAQTFQIGVATRNITPCTPNVLLAGHCKSEYIHVDSNMYATGGSANLFLDVESDLEARIFLVKNISQNKIMVLVALDLATLTAAFTDSIKQAIIDANFGINSKEEILLNVSHTHNSPPIVDFSALSNFNGCGLLGDPNPPDPAYMNAIKLRIVSGIAEAIDSFKNCSLYYGSINASFGAYRRTDNKVPQMTDNRQQIDVLKAIDTNTGELVGVCYFAACHPTTRYGVSLITSDFPGISRATLESHLATSSPRCKALFFQGFGGDIGPNGSIGTTLANNVIKVLDGPMKRISGEISITSTLKQLSLDTSSSPWMNNKRTTRDLSITEVHIGSNPEGSESWTLVAVSNEIVSEFIPYFRSHWSSSANVSLMGYTDEVAGYIPTQRMIKVDSKISGCSLSPYFYEGYGSFVIMHLARPVWHDDEIINNQHTLQETFNDLIYDPLKWYKGSFLRIADDSMSVTTDRQLVIRPLINTTGNHYNGFYSINTFDLNNKSASIEVVQPPNSSSDGEMSFSLVRDNNSYFQFKIQAGQIIVEQLSNGSGSPTTVSAYDHSSQRFLKIRHDQALDSVFWETSNDRISWITIHKEPSLIDWSAMRLEISAGTHQAEANPGVASIDNINIDSIGHDPLHYLIDNFDDDSLDYAKWEKKTKMPIHNPDVTVSEQNGMLNILPLASTQGLNYNGYSSINKYDFNSNSATILVRQQPHPSDVSEFEFAILADANNYYGFNIQHGDLRADRRISGVTTFEPLGLFDTSLHKYLRIRHDEVLDEVIWETSPDRTTWSTVYSRATDFSIRSVYVEMFGGTYSGVTHVRPILIDDLNIAKAVNLSDNFDDNTIDGKKWTTDSRFYSMWDEHVGVSEENGLLVIRPVSRGGAD